MSRPKNSSQLTGAAATAPDGRPAAAAAKRWASPRQLLVLLALIAGLALIAAGVWLYQRLVLDLPDVPAIDLSSADPEAAAAIDKARAAVVQTPRSADAWQRLAMTLHMYALYPEAAVCYGAAGLLERDNPMHPYLQGVVLEAGTDPKEALPCYERAAALSTSNLLPRVRLADLLLQMGRIDEAEAQYRKVLAADAGMAQAQFGLGRLCAARQRFDEAVCHLQAVADNPSARKRAHALLALAHQQLGNVEAAQRTRSRVADLPEDAAWPDPAQNQLYAFRRRAGKQTESQGGLRDMLRQATSLSAAKRTAEAIALLRDVVAKYPHADQAWGDLGRHLASAQDHDGAERAMRKAVELAPRSAEHQIALGGLLQGRGQMKDAAAVFTRVIDLWPTDATAHFKLGVCLFEQGERRGAEAAFRQALRRRPDMADAKAYLAKTVEPSD